MNGLQLFIFLTTLSSSLLGANRPSWLDKVPPEDFQYKYYVGRASSATDEASGFAQASQNAYETAIKENYGFKTKVQTDDYELRDRVAAKLESTKRVLELSQNVEIHDFEQTDSYKEPGNSGWNIWVLFRYSKSAIQKEKLRLLAAKEKEAVPEFSEQGSQKDASKGVLEISTTPPGAVIFIDGERYGKTPLRVLGQLASGSHTLQLDHPDFERVDEKFIINPGGTTSVEKILRKAIGTLRIFTTPANANVFIDGKPAGVTPTPAITVPAGQKLVVEISHAEANRVTQEVEVEKHNERTVNITLPLKPGYLSIQTEPTGAQVQILSALPIRNKETPTGLIELEPNTYSISVTKPGYEVYQTTLALRGGERLVLPVIALKPLSSEDKDKLADAIPKKNETLADTRKRVARLWMQYVYRGFPDPNDTKHCYELKKKKVETLAAERETTPYRGLAEIVRGKTPAESSSVRQAIPLIDELIELERNCRNERKTTPPYSGF